LFLHRKSLLPRAIDGLKSIIHRNSLIIKATSLAFFIIMIISIVAAIIVFSFVPELSEQINSLTRTALGYGDIPEPFTQSFFSLIFLNNIGHFWNPIRMIVWIPFVGPLLLGFEVLLNSGLVGVIAVIAGATKGVAYPILGLVPHGVIELPAFLLQISAIVIWQVTITNAIIEKLRGRTLDTSRMKLALRDAFILAVISVVLLFVAALIETYVTPFLLGI
jgi:stage II sporulation protein M